MLIWGEGRGFLNPGGQGCIGSSLVASHQWLHLPFHRLLQPFLSNPQFAIDQTQSPKVNERAPITRSIAFLFPSHCWHWLEAYRRIGQNRSKGAAWWRTRRGPTGPRLSHGPLISRRLVSKGDDPGRRLSSRIGSDLRKPNFRFKRSVEAKHSQSL